MDGVDEREFDERGGLACIVAGIDSSVVFLLMVVDEASLISSIIVPLKMMDAVMPIFFEIPAFMPLFSAAFWDKLFSESHRSSARRIAEITSITHAYRCTNSHDLSPSIKLRVHWIYPRKYGILDAARSRVSSVRQHRKALQIQEFSKKNTA